MFPERVFGYVHPKWRTPALNVIMVGIVALSALFFDLVTATALINFGALVAFTFVNLSVFNHFWRRKGMNKKLEGSLPLFADAAGWRADGGCVVG